MTIILKASEQHTHTVFTHVVIAAFVVLVFRLYVNGELGQERTLQNKTNRKEMSQVRYLKMVEKQQLSPELGV